MEDYLSHVLKAVTIALVIGAGKLRDMILGNKRDIVALQKDVEELKQLRAKDLIEQKSLIGLGTSIDTKIKLEMAAVVAKINEDITKMNEERHKDSFAFTNALHKLEQTLTKFNSTLDYLKGDVDNLKRKK